MYKLQNWSLNMDDSNPYQAPEARRINLYGYVYGHPRFTDGYFVKVSTLQKAEGRFITTRNSVYKLGKILPSYRTYLKDNNIDYNPQQPITL